MNYLINIFILIIFISNILTIDLSAEDYINQMDTIISFYECLRKNELPTVNDFHNFFGKNNEAELKSYFKKHFPSEMLKDNVFMNKEAIEYSNSILKNPKNYPSEFLLIIKKRVPNLFVDHIDRKIAFPPKKKGDFTVFQVFSKEELIIFSFSQNDPYIEDIFLPNGKSIYSLIDDD